jgi:hypothetical protein
MQGGVPHLECRAEVGRDGVAAVGHRDDIDAVAEEDLQVGTLPPADP